MSYNQSLHKVFMVSSQKFIFTVKVHLKCMVVLEIWIRAHFDIVISSNMTLVALYFSVCPSQYTNSAMFCYCKVFKISVYRTCLIYNTHLTSAFYVFYKPFILSESSDLEKLSDSPYIIMIKKQIQIKRLKLFPVHYCLHEIPALVDLQFVLSYLH